MLIVTKKYCLLHTVPKYKWSVSLRLKQYTSREKEPCDREVVTGNLALYLGKATCSGGRYLLSSGGRHEALDLTTQESKA